MKLAARLVIVVCLALGLLLPGAVSAAPTANQTTTLASLASDVLISLNTVRRAHGLGTLRLSTPLTAAAREHSDEMARLGYFGHSSADGTSFDARIGHLYRFTSPFRHWSVGENLVWEAPDLDASEAVRLWMASPEHRRNILDPTWKEIGISAVHAQAAPGVFAGQDATIITTDFGARS